MSQYKPSHQQPAFECSLACGQLDAALEFYTGELGFRLDAIYPADKPGVAMLSGYGGNIRLAQSGRAALIEPEPSQLDPGLVIHKYQGADSWGQGRAGMLYRDLIPGRQGGGFIASHIRIPLGGPVPDYVHYHRVLFQAIYCFRGWVKVVYEDQGPKFVLHKGDCVLQAPGIRHRVLECSDGMEVIELSAPAEHMTFLDHDLALPTSQIKPDRRFGGQRFVRHVAKASSWTSQALPGFDVMETAIEQGSAGVGALKIMRANGSRVQPDTSAPGLLQFYFVLQGSLVLATEESTHDLQANDAFGIPGGMKFTLVPHSGDLELLQLTLYSYDIGNANLSGS